jgi:hypothetical protein
MQEAYEGYLDGLFEETKFCGIEDRRVNIIHKNMQPARRIGGEK